MGHGMEEAWYSAARFSLTREHAYHEDAQSTRNGITARGVCKLAQIGVVLIVPTQLVRRRPVLLDGLCMRGGRCEAERALEVEMRWSARVPWSYATCCGPECRKDDRWSPSASAAD